MRFGTRLFSWKYLIRLSRSVCASAGRSCAGAVMMSVVSSAYVYTVESGTVLMMLLM